MRQGRITVFFRYDGFSAVSGEQVDSGVIDTFARHRLCCTVAVIPLVTEGHFRDPAPRGTLALEKSRQRLLRQAVHRGTVDVALLGLHHRSTGQGMPPSEFRGLPLAEQAEKIRRGRTILEDIVDHPVLSFVPPWNTYDEHTLQALEDNRLLCLSAGHAGPQVEDPDRALRVLPVSAELADLEAAVGMARSGAEPAPVVGVVMHPGDFRESGDEQARVDLAALDRKLAWLREQADVRVISLTALALERLQPIPAAHAGEEVSARQRPGSGTIGSYLFSGLLGAAGGLALILTALDWHPLAGRIALWCIALALAGLGWRIMMQGRVHFRSMLAVSFLIGCGLGAMAGVVSG